MRTAQILPFNRADNGTSAPFPDAQPRTIRRGGQTITIPAHPALSSGKIVGIHYVAGLMGLPDATARHLVDIITAMVKAHRLPAPLNPRLWKGRMLEGADAVCIHSRWHREDIDACFNATPCPDPVTHARAAHVDDLVSTRLGQLGRA